MKATAIERPRWLILRSNVLYLIVLYTVNTYKLPELSRYEENIVSVRAMSHPTTKIHFTSMANHSPLLLGQLRQKGFGLFVNALKHLPLPGAAGIEDVVVIAD